MGEKADRMQNGQSGMVAIGYAQVSTLDQDWALQLDALHDAGCTKVFKDQASGVRRAAGAACRAR